MPVRVLVAEDDWLVAEMMRRELERQGYQVMRVVGTGAAAVDACCREHPDVVLMDAHMPYMDGLEATRRIMETCPTPVVIVTARDRLHDDSERVGAMDCVSKPLLSNHLSGLLRHAQRRFYHFQRLAGRGGFERAVATWPLFRQAMRALANGGRHLSEEEAFAALQAVARQHKSSLERAARSVLHRIARHLPPATMNVPLPRARRQSAGAPP